MLPLAIHIERDLQKKVSKETVSPTKHTLKELWN